MEENKLIHSFLKKIIFRFDYNGLIDNDVETSMIPLREQLVSFGFTNYTKRFENQYDMEVRLELNIPNENKFMINNYSQNEVHQFKTENDEVLEISKTFLSLSIDLAEKSAIPFSKYIDVLANTIDILKKSTPFFKAIRIGLRKINICFINDISLIDRYFTSSCYNCDEVSKQLSSYQMKAANMVSLLEKNDYKINYVRNIQEGSMQINDEFTDVYQLVLDIDVYKDNHLSIMEWLKDKESISKMLNEKNDIIYDIFIRSLTDCFVEELKAKDFINTNIIGVC